MDFTAFLEGVGSNSIRKSSARYNVSKLNSSTIIGDADFDPKIKDIYNNLNLAIQSKSWSLGGGKYVVIPPTVFKNSTFTILKKDAAVKALWDLYHAKDLANVDSFEHKVDLAFKSRDVSAGSLEVYKSTLGKFGKGYIISGAYVDTKHQGQGLMYDLYHLIVSNNIPIASDSQSKGAIKTWLRLAGTNGIKVCASDSDFRKEIPLEVEDGHFWYRARVHDDNSSFSSYDIEYLVAYKG